MAAKTFDPTANPFELLANAENQSIVAPERRKKAAANKAAVEEPVGVVPTPAAKAQARAAKEAAKSTKPDGSPADNQGKQEPAKKKLTREQFEEEKRKGNNLLGEAPAGSSDVSTSSARPPRARGEGGVAGRGRGGGRGRGEGRGRGRGRGDGQGRGSDDKAGGGRGDKDKDHHYQPPVHGRDYDKKSMAKTSRNAPFKKGGSGSGGNYGTTQDDLAGQTGVDNVDQPTDDADKDNKDNKDNKRNKKNDGEEESEEDNGVLYAEYQKQKAALDAALLAKIGGTAAPRKVEGNLAGTVTKVDEEKKEEKKVEKPKVEEKVGGMKIANVEDFFHVRAPPVIRGEGRGRGRGRGGRGRGRGRGGDGDATEAGTVEGEQQTSETDQSANQSNQSNQQQGSRGRGGRGERGDSNRGQGRGGRGQGRGDRGQGRGGRGQGRGDSNGRGQGSGRGGRGGRRPNLDTSNTRHFPDLGSN